MEQELKLLGHRWAMHAIQAIAKRQSIVMRRIFTELQLSPSHINTQVQMFGMGAPMALHDYGFYGAQAASTPGLCVVLDCRVEAGDTLLHLALRLHDPVMAKVLVGHGASLEIPNCQDETPIQLVFERVVTIQLHQRQPDAKMKSTGSPLQDHYRSEQQKQILANANDYRRLFEAVQTPLTQYHAQIKERVRHELTVLYEHHVPERVGKIASQLQEFEYQEHVLLDAVKRKYVTS